MLSGTDLVAWYSSLPSWLLFIIVVWTFAWKGLAMWKAARLNKSVWFVVLLVVNTFGLLEILYLFVFSRIKRATGKRAEKSMLMFDGSYKKTGRGMKKKR